MVLVFLMLVVVVFGKVYEVMEVFGGKKGILGYGVIYGGYLVGVVVVLECFDIYEEMDLFVYVGCLGNLIVDGLVLLWDVFGVLDVCYSGMLVVVEFNFDVFVCVVGEEVECLGVFFWIIGLVLVIVLLYICIDVDIEEIIFVMRKVVEV